MGIEDYVRRLWTGKGASRLIIILLDHMKRANAISANGFVIIRRI